MVNSKSLAIYGTPAAFEQALVLLENLPQVRRVTAKASSGEMKLMLSSGLTESDLVALLAQSGISGFQLR